MYNFTISTLPAKRLIVFNSLKTLNISFNLHSILNTKFVPSLKIVVTYFSGASALSYIVH